MNDLQKLTQDLDSPTQAANLLPVLNHLQKWHAPEPTPADTAELVAALVPAVPAHQNAPAHWVMLATNLLYAQLYVVRREIWAASSLILLIGTSLAILLPEGSLLPENTSAPNGFILALIAPLVAAVGISFLYGIEIDPAIELEEATPTSQRQILLARLTLVFGFNLTLTLLASVVILLAGMYRFTTPYPLSVLIGLWLAPMTALSAFALFLTVLTGDSLVGAMASAGIWLMLSFRIFAPTQAITMHLPNLFASDLRIWLWLLAIGLSALTFWLVGREQDTFRKTIQ